MFCTFFGHQNATDEVKALLKETIVNLIQKEGVRKFLVGNNGNFDFYVQCVLSELKNERYDICFDIVLSHLGEKALSQNQSETVFPEGLEKALPRFSISKRNEWLIKNSSFLIVYVVHTFSNSYKWMQKASKRGLKIINLADQKRNAPLECIEKH